MTTFKEHSLTKECAFALINPVHTRKAIWDGLPTYLLQPPGVSGAEHLLPRLVCLNEVSEAGRVQLLDSIRDWQRLETTPFFCAYLSSTASRESLIHHLSRQLLPYGVDGRKSLLRFYSPEIFEQLTWILSSQQLAALMGPVSNWYWRDRDEQWHYQESPPWTINSVFLQREQLDQLGRSGVLNRTIQHLRREPSFLLELNAALFRQIDALLDRAYNNEGLVDEADIILFAQQALTIHPLIHRHPKLQSFLEMARVGQCSYMSACQQLSTSELQSWTPWDSYNFKERT